MHSIVEAHSGQTLVRIVPQTADIVTTHVKCIERITVESSSTDATVGLTPSRVRIVCIHTGIDAIGRALGIAPVTIGFLGKRNLEDSVVACSDDEVTFVDKYVAETLVQ